MSFTVSFLIMLAVWLFVTTLAYLMRNQIPRFAVVVAVVMSLVFSAATTTLIIKDVQETAREACGK
jgi:FtsH-binding integral membrane protein